MNIKQLAKQLSNGIFNTKYIGVGLEYTRVQNQKSAGLLQFVLKVPRFCTNDVEMNLEYKNYFKVCKRFPASITAPHTKESLKNLENVYGTRLTYNTNTFYNL